MSAIITSVAPSKRLFRPADNRKGVVANQEAKLFEPSSICESEGRLWQLPVRAASPRFALIEVFALLLFLTLAFAGIVSCFAELSHLLGSDAVGHVAMKAISGGV
jgi:hypothetical protein